MHCLLAQLSDVPADTLKSVVLIVFGVLLVAGSWSAVLFARKTRTQVTPQPLDVRQVPGVVSREFCETHSKEVSRRLDQHDSEIRTIYARIEHAQSIQESHAATRSSAIYSKIDEVRKELNDKIDTMPDRIIETLSRLNLLRRPNGNDHL